MNISFFVNGEPVTLNVAPQKRLIDILREDLLLTGCKEGCGEGECGACTVILDGQAVHACLTNAIQLQGSRVLTIEGLSRSGELDLLQECFLSECVVQCGFCTPGMILSAKALLMKNPQPSEEEIREGLSGNICRCSGYVQVVRAVKKAAKRMEVSNQCKA